MNDSRTEQGIYKGEPETSCYARKSGHAPKNDEGISQEVEGHIMGSSLTGLPLDKYASVENEKN